MSQQIHSLLVKRFGLAVLLVFAIFAVGCQFVSRYDEQTDKAVTQLHKEVETFFIALEQQAGSETCGHRHHTNFYTQSRVAVSSISIRANVIPKNDITIEQISLLRDSLNSLEKLHKLGCLSKKAIDSLRVSFNSSFTAILKFELAKKRGKK